MRFLTTSQCSNKKIISDLNNYSFSIISFLLITSGVFVIALSLAPIRLTSANYGMDGGDLLAAILTGGVPHPTGYPSYMLLGRLFQNVPYGTPVFRASLLSLIPAALAAGLSTMWAGFWEERAHPGVIVSGLVVGLTWGTSPLFLSQAVIVEVHGLQSLFIILALFGIFLLLKYPELTSGKYLFPALALAYGIGLGNHLTLLLLLPAYGMAIIYAKQTRMSLRLTLVLLAFMLTGTLVYFYLPLQARHYPPVNWGNPQSWKGFLWLVTASPYRGLLFNTPPSTLLERLGAWFNLLRQQFGVAGLALGAAGATLMSSADKRQTGMLLWVFVVYSFFALVYNTADSTAFLIPACLVFSLWIGYAILSFWDMSWRKVSSGKLLSIAMLAYLILRIPTTSHQIDPRNTTLPDEFARTLLEAAPTDALVLTQSDADTFPLWYYHFGLGWREDLAVIALPLTHFVWYQETLLHTYLDLKFPDFSIQDEAATAWGEQIPSLNPGRAVCRSQVDSADPLAISYTCQNSPAP